MLRQLAFIFVTFLSVCIASSKAIRCYTCNSVKSNAACWKLQTCPSGSNGCQNVVRIANGFIQISKGCQQFEACRSSSRQNYRQCQAAALNFIKTNVVPKNLPPSVCRSCCNTNRCNKNLYLQEEDRTGRKNPLAPGKWRPVQPSIYDVKVFLLNPDTALITFRDIKNHAASFFTVDVYPRRNALVAAVILRNNSVTERLNFTRQLHPKTLTYLASGLTAGKQYRISVVAKFRSALYRRRIFNTFHTRPRPPRKLRLLRFGTNYASVLVDIAQPGNGDRVSNYLLSYRLEGAPVKSEKRLSTLSRAGVRFLQGLRPATTYVISAWTNVVSAAGRVVAESKRVEITITTAVPGITKIIVSELHATSITWSFSLPYDAIAGSQEEFIITVRDETKGWNIVEATLTSSARSYTATDLAPLTFYTFSIKASTRGKESPRTFSDPVKTVNRCYSCAEAGSRDECGDYVECPPDSSGCLNEVRKHAITNTGTYKPIMYRASLVCKQSNACNDNEKQNLTDQCHPGRNGNVDPPEVCRCCCEGDLCNGPGSSCGEVLGWLQPFRSPPQNIFTPIAYCSDRSKIDFGYSFCTEGREIGSVCTFSCMEGYYVSGVDRSSCLDSGDWTARMPKCLLLKSCPSIDDEGMNLTCTKGFKGGSLCTVECRTGYRNTGETTLWCSRSGKWNHPVPTCLQLDYCRPNPCLNGGVCHNLIGDFECSCVAGWHEKICDEEVFCKALDSPKNGVLQCTDSNRYNSRCRYTCFDGYELHGSLYVRCLADGYWSSLESSLCVAKDCVPPPQILVNGGTTNCTGYRVGDTCDFNCPNGFTVAGGPSQIACESDQKWSGNVPCCDLPCPPHALVDLLFLLDSSSSVGKANWRTLINFTNTLLDSFVIGPDDMRVGVARYNRRFDKKNEILVGDYTSVNDLRRKLRKIPYNGGGTLTGKALWHLYNDSINAPGNRPDIPDVIVVITDGMATDNVERAASALKAKNVKIYVVGVVNRYKRMNENQLLTISSGPEYLKIITEGYQKLARDLTDQLTRDVCWLPCNFKYEQREIANRQRQLAAMTGAEEFWRQIDKKNTRATTKPTVTLDQSEASTSGLIKKIG